jgi:hypothetical protein
MMSRLTRFLCDRAGPRAWQQRPGEQQRVALPPGHLAVHPLLVAAECACVVVFGVQGLGQDVRAGHRHRHALR